MNLNFNDFCFELIDVATQGVAELTINRNGVNFSKKLVDDLGNPPFIRTMLDSEKKIFAIQVCKASDSNAIRFSKPKGEQKGGVTIMRTALMRILRTLMENDWDEEHRYQIPAKIFADAKAAVFYLETAKKTKLSRVNPVLENSLENNP